MGMYCNQCQETLRNTACTVKGACGKEETTANLHDLLIYALTGLALCAEKDPERGDNETGKFICRSLFATITNANFNNDAIADLIRQALALRDGLKHKLKIQLDDDAVSWSADTMDEFIEKSSGVGVAGYSDSEDLRSLKETVLYGMRGFAAYTDHAAELGFYEKEIFLFTIKGLAAIRKNLSAEELTEMVLETGKTAVTAMALLDRAHTSTYGNPEITEVNIGVRNNPGILVSGHDLIDIRELLEQTEGSGVDIYTHCEMLPANYYPELKKYGHLAGNYGNSWWMQNKEFESFNGPVLLTSNCITPVRDSYSQRIFTTGSAGYPGVRHIPDRKEGGQKDFSEIIELAKRCEPPAGIEEGKIIGGFAHHQVMALSDKIVEAVKTGAIKRFVVMAGCDGRQPSRKYFTQVAETLPDDAVILTAGCAKYRYNKLNLGDIGGIPRVLDAGQCNDSYSLAVIALKLKEVFGLDDINELPLSFDLAWYEQKAVTVLLALLYLGFKKIYLGPTLPAFFSPGIGKVLAEKFDIRPITSAQADVRSLMEEGSKTGAVT